ncbi:unnamed protein product, partial [marine sediment metagenome]
RHLRSTTMGNVFRNWLVANNPFDLYSLIIEKTYIIQETRSRKQ